MALSDSIIPIWSSQSCSVSHAHTVAADSSSVLLHTSPCPSRVSPTSDSAATSDHCESVRESSPFPEGLSTNITPPLPTLSTGDLDRQKSSSPSSPEHCDPFITNLLNKYGKRMRSKTREAGPTTTKVPPPRTESEAAALAPPPIQLADQFGTVEQAEETGDGLKYPAIYDFATVVMFHDWWQDLREGNEDRWFLMAKAKMRQESHAAQQVVYRLFELYGSYKRTYLTYDAPLRKFLMACLYVHHTHINTAPPGQSSTSSIKQTNQYDQLHPFLWDDFVRCLTIEFPRYVSMCQIQGRVPMSAMRYYNTTIASPKYTKLVLSRTSLETFVCSRAVQPIHAIFVKRVEILQSNILAEQAAERGQLLAAVTERKVIDQELEVLRTKQAELRHRQAKAKTWEDYLEARKAGTECQAAS